MLSSVKNNYFNIMLHYSDGLKRKLLAQRTAILLKIRSKAAS